VKDLDEDDSAVDGAADDAEGDDLTILSGIEQTSCFSQFNFECNRNDDFRVSGLIQNSKYCNDDRLEDVQKYSSLRYRSKNI